jgi:hypothetical protein
VPNAVEAAYRRGDLFEKRRKLMAAWANYCSLTVVGDSVVHLSGSGPRGNRLQQKNQEADAGDPLRGNDYAQR